MDISAFSEEAFAAYLAGFTDGEGYIGSDRPEGVRITIANCDRGVLDQIRSRLGYGTIKSQHLKPHWRERFVFDVSNFADCSDFCLRTLPYLQIKRPQAEEILRRAERRIEVRNALDARNLAILEAARSGRRRIDIAAEYGLSAQSISRLCEGHKWPSERSRFAKSRKRNAKGHFVDIFRLHGNPFPPEESG